MATIFGYLRFWVAGLSLIFRSARHPQSADEANGACMHSPHLKTRHKVCQEGHPHMEDVNLGPNLVQAHKRSRGYFIQNYFSNHNHTAEKFSVIKRLQMSEESHRYSKIITTLWYILQLSVPEDWNSSLANAFHVDRGCNINL